MQRPDLLIISRANFIVQAISGKHQPQRRAVATDQMDRLRAAISNRAVGQKANFRHIRMIARSRVWRVGGGRDSKTAEMRATILVGELDLQLAVERKIKSFGINCFVTRFGFQSISALRSVE